MQIIKDNVIKEDHWQYKTDQETLADCEYIIVSTYRLLTEGEQLFSSFKGQVGVRITPDCNVAELEPFLMKLRLVELFFPELADGRLFSHAWLLRNRYGYQGELRATGHYLPEQVFYLSRVGVNAFTPNKTADLPVILDNLNDFTVKYQKSTV